jgi:hypothetical protein
LLQAKNPRGDNKALGFVGALANFGDVGVAMVDKSTGEGACATDAFDGEFAAEAVAAVDWMALWVTRVAIRVLCHPPKFKECSIDVSDLQRQLAGGPAAVDEDGVAGDE